MEEHKSLQTIAKGAGLVMVGLFISKLLTYLYRIVVARIGAEQYGLFSLGLAVFGILNVVALFGLGNGVVRYVAYYKGINDNKKIRQVINTALKITIPISLILAFLLFKFSDWVAITFFNNQDLSMILKIIAFAIPLSAVSEIFLSTFKAFQRVEYEVYIKHIIEGVVKITLTFLFLFVFAFGVLGAVAAYVIASFGTLILSFYFLNRKVFSFVKKEKTTFNKELFSYSWPLLFYGIIGLILLWTDTFMLGYFLNASLVGIYNAASPTANLMYLVPYALMVLVLPVMTELYSKGNKDELKLVYKSVTKWILMINAVFLTLVFIFSEQILNIFFGKEYAVGAPVLILLATCYFLSYLTSGATRILMVLKKTKLIFLNSAIAAVFNIVLNYFLIRSYGIIGAAIATGTAIVIISILQTIEVYHMTKMNPFKFNNLKILISAIIVFLIMRIIISQFIVDNLYRLIAASLVFLVIYTISLLITRTLDKDDLTVIEIFEGRIGRKIGFIRRFIK
ncbi:hypothetical protein CL622_03050 [archaeon]|nr:hypothetical protein [archaeon]